MNIFTLFAVLITVTALLSYFNERYFRLPPTIGVMVAAMCLSIVLILTGQVVPAVNLWAVRLLGEVNFSRVLLEGMLSFLLFAGSLHVDLQALLARKWSILALSTIGVLTSTILIGLLFHFALGLLGLQVPLIHTLLFGALISPTDPIAVLGIMRSAGAPPDLESAITGESLFNDGIGVVVFILLLGFATGGHDASVIQAGELFLLEAVGGALYGLALGYGAFRLLRSVDNYTVEILLTLSLVAGGYALAGILHTSGPIAMVVAGLFIGNHGRLLAMSERTRQHLDAFWELMDEILNALLFVMIGLEVLVLRLLPEFIAAGLLAIPLILVVRYASVGIPITLLRLFRPFGAHTVTLLTWAGLRGGISVALALSLPATAHRELFLVVTYFVVIFSILVQGLTVGPVVRWARSRAR